MADGPEARDRGLRVYDTLYTLTVAPRRAGRTFAPSNTNGSRREGRPIVSFLPAGSRA